MANAVHCVVFLLSVSFVCCKTLYAYKRQAPAFGNGTVVGTVTSSLIDEASGLAASRKHPGYFYTHNDNGGNAEIFVLNGSGQLQSTITLVGATYHDYEDIAVGPCSQGSTAYCIYVGDTGNAQTGPFDNIYRFPEPDTIQTDTTVVVQPSDIFKFSWTFADCETLMVDPNANVYIISRQLNGQGYIAQIPTSEWGGSRVWLSTTALVGVVSHGNDPVGGDISPDGNEVLVKTHHSIWYWNATSNHDYLALLQTPGVEVPYINEPRGESVAWDVTGKGYYTLSEGIDQPLYYYARS